MYQVKFALDTPEGGKCTLVMTYRKYGHKKGWTTRKFVFPPEAERRILDLILHDDMLQCVVFKDAPTAAVMFAGLEQEYKSL